MARFTRLLLNKRKEDMKDPNSTFAGDLEGNQVIIKKSKIEPLKIGNLIATTLGGNGRVFDEWPSQEDIWNKINEIINFLNKEVIK